MLWPELAALSSLAVPTLVVVGEDDKPDFLAIAEHLAEEIPDADLAIVPGAGHLVGVDQPEELNALLLEFLQCADTSPSARLGSSAACLTPNRQRPSRTRYDKVSDTGSPHGATSSSGRVSDTNTRQDGVGEARPRVGRPVAERRGR